MEAEGVVIQPAEGEGSNGHGPASGVDCFKTDVCLGKDVIDSAQVEVRRLSPRCLTRGVSKGGGYASGARRVGKGRPDGVEAEAGGVWPRG